VAERPPETIEGEDFVLHRVQVDDAKIIADTVAANLGRLSVWMPWAVPSAGTVEEQVRRLHRSVAGWEAGTSFEYLAVHPGTGTHLGNFALDRRIGPGALRIGYWLSEDAIGYGYATAGVQLLTEAALRLTDIDRLEIHHDAGNLRGQQVPQRLGYRLDRIEEAEPVAPGESGCSLIWVYPP